MAKDSAATFTEAEYDENYEMGKRDGYEQAVQDIDELTGGDGEYYFSTVDGGCPDPTAMKAKILDRFNAEREASGSMRVTLVYVRGMLAAIKGAVDTGDSAAIPAIVDEAREKIQAVIRPAR